MRVTDVGAGLSGMQPGGQATLKRIRSCDSGAGSQNEASDDALLLRTHSREERREGGQCWRQGQNTAASLAKLRFPMLMQSRPAVQILIDFT